MLKLTVHIRNCLPIKRSAKTYILLYQTCHEVQHELRNLPESCAKARSTSIVADVRVLEVLRENLNALWAEVEVMKQRQLRASVVDNLDHASEFVPIAL